MEKDFLIKSGSLKTFPLVELLRIAISNKLTGAYRLTHERIKAVVYFHEGFVIYCASNIRSQRLVECLPRWNILLPEQIESIGKKSSDIEFVESLMETQLINKENLSDLIVKQSLEVLTTILLWTDGEWEFDGRVRLVDKMHFDIPITDFLLEGARRTLPAQAASRFSNADEKFSPEKNFSANIQLQPIEAFILSRVDIPLRLNDLLAISGMPPDVTLHSLYCLAICGMIQRESWPNPFSESELNSLRNMESLSPQSMSSKVKAKPTISQKTDQPKPILPAPKPEVDERKELETFLTQVESAQNHYDVLGIQKKSDDEIIKNSYHNLVKKFHPDKFHSEAGNPIHVRLQSAFAKLSQAYDKLRDPKFKSLYDKKLELGEENTLHGTTDKKKIAEEKFQKGFTVFSQNNTDAATTLFGQAVMLVPNDARYRAYYGKALSKNKNMRKQAETEFQAAIKLDSNNASYRVMLAEFYVEMKLIKRAESEVQRAIAIDPNNKEARRLLDSLQNK